MFRPTWPSSGDTHYVRNALDEIGNMYKVLQKKRNENSFLHKRTVVKVSKNICLWKIIHTHMYVRTCMCLCVCRYVCTYVFMYVCMYVYVCTCVRVCLQIR
jgi:hypothetical protein